MEWGINEKEPRMKVKITTKRMGLLFIVLLMAGGAIAEENSAAPTEAEAGDTAPAETVTSPPAETKATFNSVGSKMFSISYGYVTTEYQDATNDAEGWRISGTFEMRPDDKPVVQGVTIGYMETSAERTGAQTVEYEAKTIPIYYSPKIILGKKAIKVFAKGALGFHFTDYSRSGVGGNASVDEVGFYGGASLGAMVVVKEKFFLNAEYEWVYMSNSYFQDGAVQSAMIGIGMQL